MKPIENQFKNSLKLTKMFNQQVHGVQVRHGEKF